MKTLATIAVAAFALISFNARSQDDDRKGKEQDKTQESERARSTQGIITDNELKDDRGEVQSNEFRKVKGDSSQQAESEGEVIESNADQGPEGDDNRNNATNENDTTQNNDKRINTPTVIQRTSSESGSPAVLSGNNGSDRDGTNNVQRAKPNIAGAKEPGNMNLSEKNSEQKNQTSGTEKKIRKQDSKSPQTRDTKKTDTAESMPEPQQDHESGVLKENKTPEQEPATVTTAKEDRKTKRKNRRNRRKD